MSELNDKTTSSADDNMVSAETGTASINEVQDENVGRNKFGGEVQVQSKSKKKVSTSIAKDAVMRAKIFTNSFAIKNRLPPLSSGPCGGGPIVNRIKRKITKLSMKNKKLELPTFSNDKQVQLEIEDNDGVGKRVVERSQVAENELDQNELLSLDVSDDEDLNEIGNKRSIVIHKMINSYVETSKYDKRIERRAQIERDLREIEIQQMKKKQELRSILNDEEGGQNGDVTESQINGKNFFLNTNQASSSSDQYPKSSVHGSGSIQFSRNNRLTNTYSQEQWDRRQPNIQVLDNGNSKSHGAYYQDKRQLEHHQNRFQSHFRMKCPRFEGGDDDYEVWFENVRAFFRLNNYTEDEKVKIMIAQVGGEARQFLAGVEENETDTVEKLDTLLKGAFSDQVNYYEALASCKQNYGERIKSFGLRLKILASKCKYGKLQSDETCLSFLKQNSSPYFQNLLKNCMPDTKFDQALKYAIRNDRNQGNSSDRFPCKRRHEIIDTLNDTSTEDEMEYLPTQAKFQNYKWK